MLLARDFDDYELIDAGEGEKLERWGAYVVRRPEPVARWAKRADENLWRNADLTYSLDSDGQSGWRARPGLPESWVLHYRDVSFMVKPTGMKQLGLFPEQAANWEFFRRSAGAEDGRVIRVLNLFAYTGASTAVLARAGASVCHVDASRTYVKWAQQNLTLSSLAGRPVRFIVDDARKFCERELRRGNNYDAIVMDPPSFGRGSGGEVWKIDDDLGPLIETCAGLLSGAPRFFVVSFHTAGLRHPDVSSMLSTALRRFRGTVRGDDLGAGMSASGRTLPCGARCIWTSHDAGSR